MKNDLISRKALLDDLNDINETDYGSISDYRAHMAVGKALRDVCRIVDAAPSIEAEPKWISVEERLPENELSVIAYSKEDGHAWYAFRRGGSWWRPGDKISIKVYGTVTHWMPLPEPPKEDEV